MKNKLEQYLEKIGGNVLTNYSKDISDAMLKLIINSEKEEYSAEVIFKILINITMELNENKQNPPENNRNGNIFFNELKKKINSVNLKNKI